MNENGESEILESKIFVLDPANVKVREELPRIRKDMRKIEDLAESFKKFGQMQPVVLNREYELIAGGRRLAACILSGRKVRACFSDTIDPLIMREMELEENLQRESLTPAEEVLAVDEIHKLKQKIHGVAVSGKADSGWRLDDTAGLVGKTRGSVIEDLALANMVKMFPELTNAKTKSEIKKAAKGLEKVSQRLDALKGFEAIKQTSASKFDVSQSDAREHMLSIPDNSIDLLMTDPPWGIDIDKVQIGLGGQTGNDLTSSGVNYSDDKEESLELYGLLAKESARFCHASAHAYIFCAPEYFWRIRVLWTAFGWLVSPRPIIWIKNASGQNNAPHAWPSAAYEFIMFARKIDSRLVFEGRPDWIQVAPVLPSERVHPAEKPVKLIRELIERTSLPGHRMYDPFCGSGAAVEAALEMKMFPVACDKSVESYSATLERVVRWNNRSNK